ncbi:unnamed protein product [Schistosoma curassoni]|uniref:Rad60-SLD domain-containing protein n=1 Tax=Schistosoma curassoni TaxID=6186 RepID=A0A183KJI2_9TREM|nr:unnamed protein product [Schistosoma curassoni]
MQLNDLDYADDPDLPSHTRQQMQMRTNSVASASASVRFNIHKGKGKILKYNMENTIPITIGGETLEVM